MYKIINIEWDTDGEDIELPTETVITANITEDQVVDYLSEQYGWCINGCEIIKQ